MLGQAYSDSLNNTEQEALHGGLNFIIDGCFQGIIDCEESMDNFKQTFFAIHLPRRYYTKYTFLFLKQFTVCISTVGWKLAQSVPIRLASLAEELAAWAIINCAKEYLPDGEPENVFDLFIDSYFEDTDFLFLFDDKYDGIDETELQEIMGLPSLKLKDWFTPYRDDYDLDSTVHPYVASEELELSQETHMSLRLATIHEKE